MGTTPGKSGAENWVELKMLVLFAILLAICLRLLAASYLADDALRELIPTNNFRYLTFREAFQLAVDRGHQTIVETGTARDGASNCQNDGCSTVILSKLAQSSSMRVFSVDISWDAVTRSRESVKDYPKTEVIQGDSVNFLEYFPFQIDFLYLDSYDWSPATSHESQLHHLREIMAAYDKLHIGSIVLIDDCALPDGGKCAMADSMLTSLGWQLVSSQYQKLYGAGPETVLGHVKFVTD